MTISLGNLILLFMKIKIVILIIFILFVSASYSLYIFSSEKKDRQVHDNSQKSIKTFKPNNAFMIGVFYVSSIDSSIFKDISNAHINFIQCFPSTLNIDKNIEALKLGIKYNLKICANDNNIIKNNLITMKLAVQAYKNYPNLFGYFLSDEPRKKDLGKIVSVYKNIRKFDNNPDHLIHVNLLGYGDEEYFKILGDSVGWSNLSYLSADTYPYSKAGYDQREFTVLEKLRRIGYEYGANTSYYLQGIGGGSASHLEPKAQRMSPTESQLRNTAFTALAYGIKYPVWFTYSTPPNNPSEIFYDGIATQNGKPGSIYPFFCRLNNQMHQLGETLRHLDADFVCHAGSKVNLQFATNIVPNNYLWRPLKNSSDVIISHFIDRNNSNNEYVMVVNEFYNGNQSIPFELDRKINNVTEISKISGKEVNIDFNPSTHLISLNFLPGEGRLFRIFKK